MGRATTCSMILLAALCAPAFAGDDDGPVPAGTRFSTKVRYANAWSEETLSPDVLSALAGARGQSSQALAQDAKKAASETAVADAHDPLHIDMTIEGSASTGGRLALKLLVAEVKYWDGKGRSWTLGPSERAKAESTVKEVAETWQKAKSDPPQGAASRLEGEMLE